MSVETFIAHLQFFTFYILFSHKKILCVFRTRGGGGITVVQMKEAADTLVQGKKVIFILHNNFKFDLTMSPEAGEAIY